MTSADDKSECTDCNYGMLVDALMVEWDGNEFLGCTNVYGVRIRWSLGQLQLNQALAQADSSYRTNIDCMFEQLTAEGAL